MLLVNGGDMRGSTVTAARNHLTGDGRLMRVTAKAKINPKNVPISATATASHMLLTKAIWS